GVDALATSVTAAAIGILIVMLIMIIRYRMAGIVADWALVIYIILLFLFLAVVPGVQLTLPGIAGIILSLAMAVDANVLILERMREEKDKGQPLPIIIKEGYDKAWSAIFDSNLTTWIASLLLFQFGTGPVKGFALTLTLGLFVGVFTSVFVTRAIYELLLTANPKEISI
ncbi:preprotein translocase subunit SecD, partial [Candidatus Proelusimicrobium excrementi]|uniref:preprotein translocase subunit SecD n=1 Tax=Candidatus Proelusimicrobium excrementi TaxID=3416222 RepID=UPI003D13F0D5